MKKVIIKQGDVEIGRGCREGGRKKDKGRRESNNYQDAICMCTNSPRQL